MKIALLLLFSIGSLNLYAQIYPHAFAYGSTEDDYGLHIRVDDDGNVYSVGGYASTIDFGGGNVLSATGTPQFGLYVTKHNAQGEIQWAVSGGTDEEELYYLDLDAQGNVYVSGSFIGQQTFGGDIYSTLPDESNDNFIMKINSDGTVAWTRHIRGPDHEHVQGLAVADNGDIYISGFFDATFTYEGKTFTNNGNSDIFIMKFDTDNNFQWGIAEGSNGLDWPWDLAVDDNNQLYLAARFESTFDWGGITATHIDAEDMLIVKMDATNGNVQWVRTYGGTGRDEAIGIVTDHNGDVCISGFFNDAVDFGGTIVTTQGFSDGVLFKLTPSGNFLWAQGFGGTGSDRFIVQPSVDLDNNIYVGGSFIRDVVAGGVTHTNAGSRDVFVAKYRADGSFAKGFMNGGSKIDALGGIHVNDDGEMWITGRFVSDEITFGATQLTNSGSNTSDVFLVEVAEFAVGRPEVVSEEEVALYPNPFKNQFTIQHSSGTMKSYQIYNVTGQLVDEGSIFGKQHNFQVKSLDSGFYTIHIELSDGLTVQPISIFKVK